MTEVDTERTGPAPGSPAYRAAYAARQREIELSHIRVTGSTRYRGWRGVAADAARSAAMQDAADRERLNDVGTVQANAKRLQAQREALGRPGPWERLVAGSARDGRVSVRDDRAIDPEAAVLGVGRHADPDTAQNEDRIEAAAHGQPAGSVQSRVIAKAAPMTPTGAPEVEVVIEPAAPAGPTGNRGRKAAL